MLGRKVSMMSIRMRFEHWNIIFNDYNDKACIVGRT